MEHTDDERWMDRALELAREAATRGEVPVGAIVVREGVVVGEGMNLRESAQDPTAHAELIAVRAAAARLRSWRLDDCEVFVTLEPCTMCAGMLVAARVRRVVYGALDPKAGGTESLFNIGSDPRLNHRFEIVSGVRADACSAVLHDFFAEIRRRRKGR
ncbi:MAG: tRNA adenosine(34) deaminase TadA [Myxococcota bacterium]